MQHHSYAKIMQLPMKPLICLINCGQRVTIFPLCQRISFTSHAWYTSGWRECCSALVPMSSLLSQVGVQDDNSIDDEHESSHFVSRQQLLLSQRGRNTDYVATCYIAVRGSLL